MKKSHSEVIIVALLTLLMTFMEMTALPAAIFCNILFLGYRADILLNKLGKLTFRLTKQIEVWGRHETVI